MDNQPTSQLQWTHTHTRGTTAASPVPGTEGSDVVMSSMLSWSTLFQYDSESQLAGVNSRVAWIPEAGRESYLVINCGLQDFDRDGQFQAVSSDIVIKLGYTFRF